MNTPTRLTLTHITNLKEASEESDLEITYANCERPFSVQVDYDSVNGKIVISPIDETEFDEDSEKWPEIVGVEDYKYILSVLRLD